MPIETVYIDQLVVVKCPEHECGSARRKQTAATGADQAPLARDFAAIWRGTEKVVYSGGIRAQLHLLDEQRFHSGIVHLHYRI